MDFRDALSFSLPLFSCDFIALLTTSGMETSVVKKSMHTLPSPSPSPSAPAYPSSLSGGHADRESHSLSGSVMTCCHRSLWSRQECWCFRLALKGVERALPVLLRPLLPTAPFSVHIRKVCLSFSPHLLYIPHSLINVKHWAKAFCLFSQLLCQRHSICERRLLFEFTFVASVCSLEWRKQFWGDWLC